MRRPCLSFSVPRESEATIIPSLQIAAMTNEPSTRIGATLLEGSVSAAAESAASTRITIVRFFKIWRKSFVLVLNELPSRKRFSPVNNIQYVIKSAEAEATLSFAPVKTNRCLYGNILGPSSDITWHLLTSHFQ